MDREYGGAKRARSTPTFSSEHELDIIEFVKEHAELYTKEYVHYVDKAKKDRLWEEIGRQIGRSEQVGFRASERGTASSLQT